MERFFDKTHSQTPFRIPNDWTLVYSLKLSMKSELNQYVTFLTETLGIQSILTVDAKISGTEVTEIVKVLFAVEDLETYQKDELELLNKMIGALKLNESDFKMSRLLDLEKNPAQQIIIFKNKPVQSNEVYSARVLLKQPDFKRKAWDDLKRLLNI